MADIPLKVPLESNSCICPCQSYTCQKNNIIIMKWEGDSFSGDYTIEYSLLNFKDLNRTEIDKSIEDVVQVKFTRSTIVERFANISSTLLIVDLTLNGTSLTCESVDVGMNVRTTSTVCIIGKV